MCEINVSTSFAVTQGGSTVILSKHDVYCLLQKLILSGDLMVLYKPTDTIYDDEQLDCEYRHDTVFIMVSDEKAI